MLIKFDDTSFLYENKMTVDFSEQASKAGTDLQRSEGNRPDFFMLDGDD
ncbi:hypothetical protein [Anaerobacillus arseniciselenatis]|nr:hypothetical protein [Anaerobacillus arseniciselenatis]